MVKQLSIGVLGCVLAFLGCSGEGPTLETVDANQTPAGLEAAVTDQIVEVSCGQCQLGMAGDGCDIAVRIEGKTVFVDGSSIDDHGDAHGDDGLCNCIRKAKVSGEVKDGRFVSTAIEVLPMVESSD